MNKILFYSYLSYWIGSLSLGFFLPFVAIFITQQVIGGSALVVGVASTILLWTQAGSLYPGGKFLDKVCKKSPERKFYFFSANLFSDAFLIFSFQFITFSWQLYFVQALRGLIKGFTASSIMVVFSTYLDQEKAGSEWGIQGTMTLLLHGLAAPIAGILVDIVGLSYRNLFLIAGLIYLAGALISLLMIRTYKISKTKTPDNDLR